MTDRLQGKVALITGAGSVGPGWGNGRAMTIRFAQEGAQVFAADIDETRLDETLSYAGDEKANIQKGLVDVMQSSSIEKMVQECLQRFGRIDILVNNVGGSAKGGPVEMTEEVWDTQVDYNLKSVFLTCKYVLPGMIQQGSGAIINMASTSGMRWTGSAQIAYAATKAGIIQFSKVLAVQYAKQNIRVNTIVPGQLHTPMVETRLAKQRTGGDVATILEQRQARIPLPFMGDGMDTANAAVFLASEEARFITGTEIVIDGGMSAKCD
jgi:NAD(P)-dependent dehydrogenase (short-subunit alcohol dehydrogenase family)